MRRKGLAGTIFLTFVLIIAVVAGAATYFVLQNYVVLDWELIPRDETYVDLHGFEMDTADYDRVAGEMPYAQIVWDVPFQGGRVSCQTESITVSSLSREDLAVLPYFLQLKTVQAETCRDYSTLLALYQSRPDLQVIYRVVMGDQSFPADAKTIALSSFDREYIPLLSYLPELKTIDGTRCRDFLLMQELAENYPNWEVRYVNTIAGVEIDPKATAIELRGATFDDVSYGLATMPMLTSFTVHNPAATGAELISLREQYPNVKLHWDVEVFGETYPDTVEELDISQEPIASLELAREIAGKFPNLTKLILNTDGIENEEVAAYREEARSQYKVVWTVKLGKVCVARTDDTWFMPIRQGDYYFTEEAAYNLRYCEDMVCLDLGHHLIKTLEFARFMPHLKYLILAWTLCSSVDGLENCKELIYLEVDHSGILNLDALVGCTALEDLNINECYAPVDPLLEMPWLKNLWVTDRSYTTKMRLVEGLPDTNVVTVDYSSYTGMGWRNLQNYYEMRDYLGMYYMD